MYAIHPYFLNEIKNYINKGYNLTDILKEYSENGLFIDEITTHYYHLNNGPDLRDYQKEAIEEARTTFIENNNYKLFWSCGLGKTKTSLTIAKQLNFKTILIGVPSILLMHQFAEEMKYFYPLSQIIMSRDTLKKYIKSNNRYKIVLTTYHSAQKILSIVNQLNFVFDFIILDEAHHLHDKSSKLFSNILKVPFKKRLLLTATPYIGAETNKCLSLERSNCFQGASNTKSISWAIENKYIVDYNILIFNFDSDDLNLDLFNCYENKELVLAAYMAVKCIFNAISKKIIIYCNTVKNAKIVQEIIGVLLKNHCDDIKLYNPNKLKLKVGNYELNGNDSLQKRNDDINLFKQDEYGIMSSVQIFGEGFNYPQLDGALFAEKMSSDIRIVQSAMRPCRTDVTNPNKIANILLPFYNDNFGKIKQVILKLKSVDNIINKIKIIDRYSCNSLENKPKCVRHSNQIGAFDLSLENKKLLEKIKLEYLKATDVKYLEIYGKNFTKSKIISCQIKNNDTEISTKKRYSQIIVDIWKTISKDDILKLSTFNFKHTKENRERGYNWCEPIKMSFQGKDANKCIYEIVKLAKHYKYYVNMKILLHNGNNFNLLID